MTTDITELAQRMKAAAVRAKAATEDYVAHRMSITVCLEECKEFNDLSDGPDNILALLETLELKEEQRANWFQMAQKLGEDLDAAEKRIAELEDAEQKLCAANVTLDARAELAERQLAELERFRTAYMEWSDKTDWVNADKRLSVVKPWGKHRADVLKAYIEHLESRTVKLPKKNIGWDRDEADCWNNAIDAFAEAMTATGIKWEAE